MAQDGRVDIKAFLFAAGVVVVLVSPLVFVGYRISRWFHKVSEYTEGTGVDEEEVHYILLEPAKMSAGRHRSDGQQLDLPTGTVVESVVDHDNGQVMARKSDDGKELLLVRYEGEDDSEMRYYAWLPKEDLQKAGEAAPTPVP